MPQLLSVNVGLPRDIAWRGETVHTAVWKESVQGRRMVRRLNLDARDAEVWLGMLRQIAWKLGTDPG